MMLVGKITDIPVIEKPINPIDHILDFIVTNYPVSEYKNILEIAAGSGILSSKLSSLGYQVTAMDPKINTISNGNYQILSESFTEKTDISNYDLGIAIHPCGIHKDIIKNFTINEKALFLMPCYKITCDNSELIGYKDNEEWLDYLEKLNPKMKRKDFFDKNSSNILVKSFTSAFYTK